MRELTIRTNGKSKAAMLSVSQELAIGYLSGIACRSISSPEVLAGSCGLMIMAIGSSFGFILSLSVPVVQTSDAQEERPRCAAPGPFLHRRRSCEFHSHESFHAVVQPLLIHET